MLSPFFSNKFSNSCFSHFKMPYIIETINYSFIIIKFTPSIFNKKI